MSGQARKISILGSTGSIGIQTLQVLDSIPGHFEINFLTTNTRIDILEEQIQKYKPAGVVITNEKSFIDFKNKTKFNGKILFGLEGLYEAASNEANDLVVTALVGFSGVLPTLFAIRSGKDVALANKETLVSAGSVIMHEAKLYNTKIIAIDSEHSAILQCIAGESKDEIEKIILTASGGPFLNTPLAEFQQLTVAQALSHPNWSMGKKITIDSATMINKGFEVIEAYWLFGLRVNQIEIVIHPQSIIHSMVQFIDGSIKAQLGKPDMRIPISYALTYPRRMSYDFPRLELTEVSNLTFIKPDFTRFPCLKLAFDALNNFGTAPTILNAANEIAVNAFLEEKIRFVEISSIIDKALSSIDIVENPDINQIQEADIETRNFVESLIR